MLERFFQKIIITVLRLVEILGTKLLRKTSFLAMFKLWELGHLDRRKFWELYNFDWFKF